MARNKGSGTLVKRGKYYMAKWIVNGKIFTKTTKCTIKEDALLKLKEFTHPFQVNTDIERIENLEAKIRNEEKIRSVMKDEYSECELKDVIETYNKMANASKVTENTERVYDNMLKQLIKFLDEKYPLVKRVKDLDADMIEAFLVSIKPTFCSNRYNGLLSKFKAIWREFGENSHHRCFHPNPWGKFKYAPKDVSLRRTLTVEELAKVLSYATKPEINLLFCLGIYTGMRISDCCMLKWSEVDLVKREIRRIPMKTRRFGTVSIIPIHPVLLKKLLQCKVELERKIDDGKAYDEDKEYVSFSLCRKYKNRTIETLVRKIFNCAGIKTCEKVGEKVKCIVSFHSLRHTFVSMAATAGVSLDVVKNIVGHTDVKMTEEYDHISIQRARSAIDALPAIGMIGENAQDKKPVEISEETLSKVSKMTDKSVEEILKDYISKHEKKESDMVFDINELQGFYIMN